MIRQDWSTLKKLMFMKAAAGGGSAAVERMATGNPVVFGTDLAKPLRSLLIPFTPVQSGTGDPSPQNIRSILPWDGLKVNQIGENAWGNGTTQNVTRYIKVSLLKPIPPGTYTITATVETNTESSRVGIGFAKGENMVIETVYLPTSGRNSATFTINETVTIVYLYAGIDYSTSAGYTATYKGILIEAGTKAPTETDIVFPSPVYGGTLDVVSGVLTVTHVCLEVSKQDFTLSGSGAMPYMQTAQAYTIQHKPKSRVDWSKARQTQKMDCAVIANPYSETTFGDYIGVCFYDTNLPTAVRISRDLYDSLQDGDSVSVCYEIEDPFDVQLTGEQITAIKGENTVWSDANGSLTAVYLVSSKYAEEHPVGGLSSGLGSGLLGSNPDPDEPIENPEENPEE